jgi:hypothetical protein
MEILKTKNYDDFSVIISNREVDKAHVKRLAASIKRKNLLYIRPILVNNKMQIIDGQHRLAAAEQLGEFVYYLKVQDLDKDDIAILNTAQKNWSRMDFINFYAVEGKPEFKELCNIINKYKILKPSFILRIVGECKHLREGKIRLIESEYARKLCDWILALYDKKFHFVESRDFGVAAHELSLSDWNMQNILKSAKKANLYKCPSVTEYKQLLKNLSI